MNKSSSSMSFALVGGHWYGLTMFPGYSDCPYHSPIRIDSIELLGDGLLQVSFLNIGYAAGAQSFRKRFRTLQLTASYLVAEDAEVRDRTYVITQLNRHWIERHFPSLPSAKYFDTDGMPNGGELIRLAATAC